MAIAATFLAKLTGSGTVLGGAGVAAPGTLGVNIDSGSLLIVTVLIGLVAVVALVNVATARREARAAARLARSRAQGMKDLLRTVRMAETIAGIGVWQYDPKTGVQHWSNGLKRLFGMDQNEELLEGDAETFLFAHDIDLVGKVMEHCEEVEPFTLEFDIHDFDGDMRSMSVHACNLMNRDGTVHRVVAVVRDNTQQVQRERRLECSRAAAINEAQRARWLAETDSLTGLANRRRIMSELDHMVMKARITQMPLTLIVFDIDHFKRVNDTHGHAEGDKVLRKVANIALEQADDRGIVGRVGGEEFVWIIPGASDGMTRVLSERLRLAVATESATDVVPAVTISLGYTVLQPGDTGLSLFARADSALYQAKGAGRNRVRMAA